jgi:hypothetical protein
VRRGKLADILWDAFIGTFLLICVLATIGLLYVAVHFIRKFW